MVEGGKTPFVDIPTLDSLGFKIGLYPISLLLSVAQTVQMQLKLLAEGDYGKLAEGQVSFETLKEMIGWPEYDEMRAQYET